MTMLEIMYDIFTYVFLVFFPILSVLGVVVCIQFIRWLCFDMKQPTSYEIVLSETPTDTETASPSLDASENKR